MRGPQSISRAIDVRRSACARRAITVKRDRLLASLTLIAGIGLIVALPFALRAGAEFFMPVTAALVVAIALVPLLEWFERRGVPSQARRPACASIIFLLHRDLRDRLDRRSGQRLGRPGAVQDPQGPRALEPVLDLYKNLDRFIDRTASQIAITPTQHARTVRDRDSPTRCSACSPARRRIC